MRSRQGILKWLTNPWLALGLLLLGLAIGTWLPVVGAPFAAVVGWLFGLLSDLAWIIILVTVLPALLALYDTGSGEAPIVVVLLFTFTTAFAGVYALFVAWLAFGLPLSGGIGGGFVETISQIAGLFGTSRPMFGVLWAFLASIVLQVLIVIDRRMDLESSWWRRAVGGVSYVGVQTSGVFHWIGTEGIPRFGRYLELALPFILFSVGTFVPSAVAEATELLGEASTDFAALPWYLGTAGLIAVVTFSYLLVFALIATTYAGASFKEAIRRYVPPVYGFGWASSSSSATIPVNIDAAHRHLGVRMSVCEFVLPLGATINLDGTMIAAVIITPVVAKALGLQLSLSLLAATLIPLVVMTAGAPGIPSGIAFIAPPAIADIIGLSGETAVAFAGVWAAFAFGLSDQFRTGVNVCNDGMISLITDTYLHGPQTVLLEEFDEHALEAAAR